MVMRIILYLTHFLKQIASEKCVNLLVPDNNNAV